MQRREIVQIKMASHRTARPQEDMDKVRSMKTEDTLLVKAIRIKELG